MVAQCDSAYSSLLTVFERAGATPHLGVTMVDEAGGKSPGETFKSYRELGAMAAHLAAVLYEEGVRPGDRVVLVLPTGHAFVAAFFAVQRLGAIPVAAYPPTLLGRNASGDHLIPIVNDAGAAWCVTSQAMGQALAALNTHCTSMRATLVVDDMWHRAAPPPPAIAACETAFMQYTSGSTALPKGVCISQTNVLSNVHGLGSALQLTPQDLFATWVPLYHDLGLVGQLLLAIYWQNSMVLMTPHTFMLRPDTWLWAIHRHRATISAAPNFAYGRCLHALGSYDLGDLNLASWRFSSNGGEMCRASTVQAFQRALAPYGLRGNVVKPTWGMAETTVAVTVTPQSHPTRCENLDRAALAAGQALPTEDGSGFTVMSVGVPLADHAVEVRHSDGGLCADGCIGDIMVRGPSVMTGYFGNDTATAAVLRDGWLRTGDLGYWRAGELFITGRSKDVLIVRGRKIYPEDLEWAAEQVIGVRPGGSVAFGVYDERRQLDRAVLLCETRVPAAEHAELVREVMQRVRRDCDVNLAEVVPLAPGSLPKTSSGKRQRSRCRRSYQEQAAHGD